MTSITAQEDHLRRQMQILEHLQESVITMDLSGVITSWNQGAERLFGYSADEAIGRHVLFLYADDDGESAADAEGDHLEDLFAEKGGRELEVKRKRKNGETFWASLQLSLMRDDDGTPCGLIGFLTDITARRATAEMLKLHSRIFDESQEGIMITDANKKIVAVNPAFSRITGYAAADVIGQHRDQFRSNRHDAEFYKSVRTGLDTLGYWQGEMWSRRHDGEIFPAWVSVGAVVNAHDHVTHTFFILNDITERKRTEGRMHHLAFYDELTNLPNRALFHRLLDQALIEAERLHLYGAVLFLDLNRFKPINDTLGHAVGDQVLHEIADRLRNCLRGADVVARIGGDEFVVGLFDISQREHAGLVAQKLLTALEIPLVINDNELSVGAAIGISVFPEDGLDTDTLLRLADIAMYRAKESGPDTFVFFSEDMNARAVSRISLEAHLRRGIERNELQLYYQPKVSLVTGKIVGAEALVRWRHPDRGMIPPGDFIPVAEETGLIVQISNWVLEEACDQARRWKLAGLPTLRIAVNLSARDFSPVLPDRVMSLLSAQKLGPEWLELEITEGMLMNKTEKVIEMMDELARLKISLSLDDFGTGYSSLSYLKRFPIHSLKIDRSFVINTPDDSDDCAITGAIVSMAKALKHNVIAEGVETRAQLDFLRQLGCDEMQGYLFSAPVTADKFEAMVRDDKRLPL